MTFISANDAFSNPNSPWYYVVGSAFLALIIAALVVYMLVSKRKSEAEEKKIDVQITDTLPPDNDEAETRERTDEQITADDAPTATEEKVDEQSVETEEKSDETVTAQEVNEEEVNTAAEQVSEEGKDIEGDKVEDAAPTVEDVSPEPEQKTQKKPKGGKTNNQPTIKIVNAKNIALPTEKKKPTAPKKTTTSKAKNSQKPFIDRLIAAKDVHGIYNELKNTVLSYPGMKAKLGKDSETFSFAAQTKAEISLDGSEIVLKVAVDPDGAAEFGAQTADGELKTMLAVSTGNIDSANRLITYAMNTAMLTRNDKHRHVDYVQNAIKAKEKAKAKQAAAKTKK